MEHLDAAQEVGCLTQAILEDYRQGRDIDRLNVFEKPDKQKIIDLTDKLIRIIFPGFYREKAFKMYHAENSLRVLIEDVYYRLNQQIDLALRLLPGREEEGKRQQEALEKCSAFFRRIPAVRALV